MVLVDSSIIIDFINKDKYRNKIMALLATRNMATTDIIIMEVLQGIKEEKKFQNIKSFLESLPKAEMHY